MKFNFKDETKQKIKALLLDLQRQRQTQADFSLEQSDAQLEGCEDTEIVRNVIEILTSVLFEAVQFAGILPNMMVDELANEASELRNIA